jgi:hypothetical protein
MYGEGRKRWVEWWFAVDLEDVFFVRMGGVWLSGYSEKKGVFDEIVLYGSALWDNMGGKKEWFGWYFLEL